MFFLNLKHFIQQQFDEKTKIIDFIVQDSMVKTSRDNMNTRWTNLVIFINFSLICLTIILSSFGTFYTSGLEVCQVFISNILVTFIVIIIQLYIFHHLKNFNYLSHIDFEVAILNEILNLINKV